MLKLKKYLFEHYEGFGDKRIKDISKDYPFKIDDQNDSDKHEHFCGIFITVRDDNNFELHLTNNAPINNKIKRMVKEKNGNVQMIEKKHSSIEVNLTIHDHEFISKLANEIRELILNKRYKNANWKWLCPRTARSLKRFSEILIKYRK